MGGASVLSLSSDDEMYRVGVNARFLVSVCVRVTRSEAIEPAPQVEVINIRMKLCGLYFEINRL